MTQFIFIILLSVFDFWVVKNITGRILVKLRWWRVINDEGTEEWRFENEENEVQANKVDKKVFWYGQTLFFLYWLLVFFLKLISLNIFWGVLSLISLSLSGVNLYGYYKCSREINKKAEKITNQLSFISYIPSFFK